LVSQGGDASGNMAADTPFCVCVARATGTTFFNTH
jgi:hypothetical protein